MIPGAHVGNKAYWAQLSKALVDRVAATERLAVLHNPALRLYSRPDESPDAFAQRCRQSAQTAADAKAAALRSKYESRMRTLQTRLGTASSRAQQVTTAGMMDSATSVLGGFLRGRRGMSSIGIRGGKRSP